MDHRYFKFLDIILTICKRISKFYIILNSYNLTVFDEQLICMGTTFINNV
jgi:hypothetical protein